MIARDPPPHHAVRSDQRRRPPSRVRSDASVVRPGNADSYGSVAPGRYGSYGYSGGPGHPANYVDERAALADAGERYRQADERLRELICERLTEDPDIDASDVTVAVERGRARLTGSVGSRRARRLVTESAENCGAQAVIDELTISARR